MDCLMIVILFLWCVVFCGSHPHDFGKEQMHRGTPPLPVIKTLDHELETDTISITKPNMVRNNYYSPNGRNINLHQHHPDLEPPSRFLFPSVKLPKPGLQIKNNNVVKPALMPLVFIKGRYKRATNQHADISATSTPDQKQMNDQEDFIQNLLSDPGFITNFNKVFPPEPVRNKTDVKDNTTAASVPTLKPDGPSNKNNTGLDDRLQGRSVFHKRYEEFLKTPHTDNKKPTAPDTAPAIQIPNEVDYESFDALEEQYHGTKEQEQAILEVFGRPQMAVVNVTLENNNYQGTTERLNTARTPQKPARENNKNSSIAQKSNIYVNFVYSLTFILLLAYH